MWMHEKIYIFQTTYIHRWWHWSTHNLTKNSLILTLHLFSRRTYWDLCPPQGRWPLALDGEEAAGAEHVLLLWRRARSFLASLNYVWGEWSFIGYGQVRNLFNSFKWDWIKMSQQFSFQPLCSFQDKLYILSSQEAYQKFITNPRRYLLPPMPRSPCRVSIIGPPQAGKSTLCKLLAQHYNTLVLDVDVLLQPVLAEVEQERLDKIKEETTRAALEKIKMKMEQDGGQNSGKLKLFLKWLLHNVP